MERNYKISDEEILEDFKKVGEKLDKLVTSADYAQEGSYDIRTIKNRFGNMKDIRKRSGNYKQQLNKQEKHLKQIETGRYKAYQLFKDMEKEEVQKTVKELIQGINKRDNKLNISKKSNNRLYWFENNNIERYQDIKNNLDSKLYYYVQWAVSNGKSPYVAAAAGTYIAKNDYTQEGLAELYGVTQVSIRNFIKSFNNWVEQIIED